MSHQSTEQGLPERTSPGLKEWREQHRFSIQTVALVLTLAAPFGLYRALNAGQDGPALVFAAAILLGMALIIWV